MKDFWEQFAEDVDNFVVAACIVMAVLVGFMLVRGII